MFLHAVQNRIGCMLLVSLCKTQDVYYLFKLNQRKLPFKKLLSLIFLLAAALLFVRSTTV